jgi:hypothetical protein
MQGSSNMALAFLGPAQEVYRDKAARRNKQSATLLQEIGRGRFHTVYKIESGKLLDDSNFTGPWAYKVLANETFSDRETALICPQRSVRVMQEIDPEMPVGLYEGGWIMPFTPGESTLEEIALAEDDIFKNTRRVILDADKHNIVKGRLMSPSGI